MPSKKAPPSLKPCVVPADMEASCFFAVDCWAIRDNLDTYFLTHTHADHLVGLNDAWVGGTIYCSLVTAVLLKQRWPNLQAPVVVLEMDQATDVLVGPYNVHLRVSIFDAHHCAGAVQLLFDGPVGRILHTGDCRWEEGTEVPSEILRAPIDYMFVDNTYCNAAYRHPTRIKATEEVVRIVKAHPTHRIQIGVDGVGKEDLLAAVARATGSPVYVPEKRMAIINLLGLPASLFTTDKKAALIHATPRYLVKSKYLEDQNAHRPILAIVPTGWSTAPAPSSTSKGEDWTPTTKTPSVVVSAVPQVEAHPLIHAVAYSLHSCFHEIEAYVKLVQPRFIAGQQISLQEGEASTDPEVVLAHLARDSQRMGKFTGSPLHRLMQQLPKAQAPQAAARSRAAGREKTETKTERKGKGKTANAPTARRLDDGGGYGGGGAIAASSGGGSRWSYVAIARRDARRRTGRCMAMLTQPEELNCESSGCSMHKVSIRELGVAAAAAAGAAGPLPWELGASGDGGCAPWHVFAALGVLHRHRSRPPPRSLPLPAAVAGVLRLMAKKRASPHDSKRKWDDSPGAAPEAVVEEATGGGCGIPGVVLGALGVLARATKRRRHAAR